MTPSQRAREAAREIDPLLAEEMPESEEFQRIIAVIARFESETLERAAKCAAAKFAGHGILGTARAHAHVHAGKSIATAIRNLIGDSQ